MSRSRLADAFVFVVHLEPMVRFYESVFGFVCRRSPDPGFAVMEPPPGSPAGAAGVALHTVPDAVAQQIDLQTPPRWRDDTAYKLTFATDDLDACRDRILAHGGQAKDPWAWDGRRYCECTDPEGNVVQLVEDPAR